MTPLCYVIAPKNDATVTHILVSDRNIFFEKSMWRHFLDQAHMIVKGFTAKCQQGALVPKKTTYVMSMGSKKRGKTNRPLFLKLPPRTPG